MGKYTMTDDLTDKRRLSNNIVVRFLEELTVMLIVIW